MPEINSFKMAGTRLVPVNRFNLEPAKPSIAFKNNPVTLENKGFISREHLFIRSIDIGETAIIPMVNEYYPRVTMPDFNQNTAFNDHFKNEITLKFQEIKIEPFNGDIFYYEDILDSNGKISGYSGYVILKFDYINNSLLPDEKYIPLNLLECVLNLNVLNNGKNEIVKVNGIIDPVYKYLKFNLKDEAVKIAFLNLVTGIEEQKCSIDLFFQFKAYSLVKRRIRMAREFSMPNFSRNISANKRSVFGTKMDSRLNSIIDNPVKEYEKTVYLLKINKTINFPLGKDKAASLYQTTGGGFIDNPFNLNNSFTEYQQIFLPGIPYSELSIYKSAVQPNTFLLFSKKYIITRTVDDLSPSVSALMHQNEEGTTTTEDISKIDFIFAVGPDLSLYDLAKLKIELFNSKLLDLDKNVNNIFNSITFLYPGEIGADYELSGNALLNDTSLVIDGKNIIFTLTKEHLSDASLIINALDNSVSLYANLTFKIKEIRETSIVELNIEKTGGDILDRKLDNGSKTITVKNKSLAKCKINSLLLLADNNETYNNVSYFQKYKLIDSAVEDIIDLKALDKKIVNLDIKEIFFGIDIIEDKKQEFKQTVNTASTFIKYIQIQPVVSKKTITKLKLSLFVLGTNTNSNFELIKNGKSFDPILFSVLTPTNMVSTKITHEARFFDKNDNQILFKSGEFDFAQSAILEIKNK